MGGAAVIGTAMGGAAVIGTAMRGIARIVPNVCSG